MDDGKIYLSQKTGSGNVEQQGETITVSGVVSDTSGEFVIGATVVVVGDVTKGTVTDLDGNFQLTGVPKNATISISYIGYQTVELPANSPQLANVVLTEDCQLLDELVVVGYGTQKKDLMGAASALSGDNLTTNPIFLSAGHCKARCPGLT